jgi:hypothetical protein
MVESGLMGCALSFFPSASKMDGMNGDVRDRREEGAH